MAEQGPRAQVECHSDIVVEHMRFESFELRLFGTVLFADRGASSIRRGLTVKGQRTG